MGIFDSIFGGGDQNQQQPQNQQQQYGRQPQNADEQAIARYRYMLQTAPPETIEQAHAEAFAKLTPEQRRTMLQEISSELPENERQAAAQNGENPQNLARLATRAEVRQPGTIERMFGGNNYGGGGMGFGGMLATSFLGSIAGSVVGSAIASQFFNNDSNFGDSQNFTGNDSQTDNDAGNDANDSGDFSNDLGGDFGGDSGGGDFSGGFD
ncbi:MAG: hypothetical protein H7Z37_12100 [Pyrinomonadaceae bacterium]|nr:hypothetical protein [Pyrinomonadaceae bacterium]